MRETEYKWVDYYNNYDLYNSSKYKIYEPKNNTITHSQFIEYKNKMEMEGKIDKVLDEIDDNDIQIYLRNKKLKKLMNK